MPAFYASIDKRNFFSAPQLNIQRHTYRGPRSSEKINLEIGQLNFSIRKLYEKYEVLFGNFRTYSSLLLEGGDTEVDDSDGNDYILLGLAEFASRLVTLQKRVKALEATGITPPPPPSPPAVT